MCAGRSVCSHLEPLVQPLACHVSPRQRLIGEEKHSLGDLMYSGDSVGDWKSWDLGTEPGRQCQLKHVILPSLPQFAVCKSETISPYFLKSVQEQKLCVNSRVHRWYSVSTGTWGAKVCCFSQQDSLLSEHSLPNGVWLHLGETACTFTLDNLGQNSWSEDLSYGGSSLIIILNGNSYPVWPNSTRNHGLRPGLLPHGPSLSQHGEMWLNLIGICCIKQSSNISQKEQLHWVGIPLMSFYLTAVI